MRNKIPCNTRWYVVIQFNDMPDDADVVSMRRYLTSVQSVMSDVSTSIPFVGKNNPISLRIRIITLFKEIYNA